MKFDMDPNQANLATGVIIEILIFYFKTTTEKIKKHHSEKKRTRKETYEKRNVRDDT